MSFPVEKLLDWYCRNKRDLPWRSTTDMFAIWVSEIMLQQTQVNTVIPYYLRFLERFPTVDALAGAEEQEVLKLWEGLGYYSRARNLHRAAKKVVDMFNGEIPRNYTDFISLPGVGPYVAADVLSITCNIPLPVVDGNVLRVYSRFFTYGEDIRKTSTRDHIFKELKDIIPVEAPGDFNQAIMELGASVCTPKSPDCSGCPLNSGCRAFLTGSISKYPFKSSLPKAPQFNVSIAVIMRDREIFIQKRPSEGHLGGLWEFPGGKAEPGESPEIALYRECQEELGVDVRIVEKLTVVQHAYSHFKIHLSVFLCRLPDESVQLEESPNARWISVEELNEFPFPKANHKFFAELKSYFAENIPD